MTRFATNLSNVTDGDRNQDHHTHSGFLLQSLSARDMSILLDLGLPACLKVMS